VVGARIATQPTIPHPSLARRGTIFSRRGQPKQQGTCARNDTAVKSVLYSLYPKCNEHYTEGLF